MAYLIPAPTAFPVIPDFQSSAFVNGFELAITGDTLFTVQPGMARAMASDFVIAYPSFSANLPAEIEVDIAEVGPNGCFPVSIDSLALADKTMFGVYAIAKSSGTTGGSLNAELATAIVVATGNNFLPAGYDVFRRIGLVYVDDATGFLIYMAQSGHANERIYRLNEGPLALSGGNATVQTELDLTAGDGIIRPGSGTNAILGLVINGFAGSSYLQLWPTDNLDGNGTAGLVTPAATETMSAEGSIIVGQNALGNAAIDYLVDNAGTTASIVVAGFVDSLGLNLF